MPSTVKSKHKCHLLYSATTVRLLVVMVTGMRSISSPPQRSMHENADNIGVTGLHNSSRDWIVISNNLIDPIDHTRSLVQRMLRLRDFTTLLVLYINYLIKTYETGYQGTKNVKKLCFNVYRQRTARYFGGWNERTDVLKSTIQSLNAINATKKQI